MEILNKPTHSSRKPFEVEEIVRIFWIKKVPIIFLSIGFVALAFFYHSQQPTVYEARVLLQSSESVNELDSRVSTYAKLMNTATLANYVASETVSPTLEPGAVIGRADIEYVSGTLLFYVNVTDASDARAVSLANASAQGLVRYLNEKIDADQQKANLVFEKKMTEARDYLYSNDLPNDSTSSATLVVNSQLDEQYWSLYSYSIRRQLELGASNSPVTVVDPAETALQKKIVSEETLALSAFMIGLIINGNIFVLRERFRPEEIAPEEDEAEEEVG